MHLLNIIGGQAVVCLLPFAVLLKQGGKKPQFFNDVFHTGFICVSFVGRVGSWHQFGSKGLQLARP